MIFPARNLDDSFGGFPSDVFDDRGGAPRELPWVRSPAWTGAVRPERGQASSYNYSVSVSHNNYIYLLMNVLILNHCLTRNDRASATNTTGRGKKTVTHQANQLKYIYENKTFETSKMLVNFHDKRSLHVISSRMKHQLHGDRNLYPPCDKGK